MNTQTNKIELSLPNIKDLYIIRGRKEYQITTYEDVKRYLKNMKKN